MSDTVRRLPASRGMPAANSYLDEFPFTGPDRPMGRYLRQFWHPVSRSVDLPAGKAKPIQIMNSHYTLYRGQSGACHIVDYRCPHRGTQLSAGWVEGEEIRCIYHGWKFAGDGKCTERPGEAGKLGAGIRIRSYPAQEFFGLIYAYFGEGEPPPFPPLPDFEEEQEGVVEAHCTVLPVNWFQGWENDWDVYHARFTHRTGELHQIDYDRAYETETIEETDFGFVRTFDAGETGTNTAILTMPATIQLLIPTYNGQAREGGPTVRRTFITHVPIDDHSHWAFLSQLVPLKPEEREAYYRQREAMDALVASYPSAQDIARDALANGLKVIEDFRDHPLLVRVEDMFAQMGQGLIADRHAEHLGRTDAGIVFLRRFLARELEAMAQGLPTKDWKRSPVIPFQGWYGQS